MTALAELTTLRLGGPAGRLVDAATEDEVLAAVRAADATREPLLILAGGSNLVVADAGFPGTVLRIATRGVETTGDRLDVAGGRAVGPVRRRAASSRGAPASSACRAFPAPSARRRSRTSAPTGRRSSESIVSVRVYDRVARARRGAAARGVRLRLPVEPLQARARALGGARRRVRAAPLGAARSRSATPELARALGVAPGERAPLADVRGAVLALRRAKGMVVDPADPDSVSAGSFFTNPVLDAGGFARLEARARARLGPDARVPRFPQPGGAVKVPAAWLIERAGFTRGHGDPATVAISAKHTLALTNRGAGTTAQLVALAREIAGGVEEAFGVRLEPEPVFVGHVWS